MHSDIAGIVLSTAFRTALSRAAPRRASLNSSCDIACHAAGLLSSGFLGIGSISLLTVRNLQLLGGKTVLGEHHFPFGASQKHLFPSALVDIGLHLVGQTGLVVKHFHDKAKHFIRQFRHACMVFAKRIIALRFTQPFVEGGMMRDNRHSSPQYRGGVDRLVAEPDSVTGLEQA